MATFEEQAAQRAFDRFLVDLQSRIDVIQDAKVGEPMTHAQANALNFCISALVSFGNALKALNAIIPDVVTAALVKAFAFQERYAAISAVLATEPIPCPTCRGDGFDMGVDGARLCERCNGDGRIVPPDPVREAIGAANLAWWQALGSRDPIDEAEARLLTHAVHTAADLERVKARLR